MCTALSLKTKDFYFGRTLDIDCSYGEEVCVMPRKFPFIFRKTGHMDTHFAMIGMATVAEGVPLFYDAVNEHGLSMAGLNFPDNAYYPPVGTGKDNIAPFEFIPWILMQCKNLEEAKDLLAKIRLCNIPFSDKIPLAPLHWIIADHTGSVVVESMKEGLRIYDNPVGILTNNPPFEYQLFNLNNYRRLGIDNGESSFSKKLPLTEYCQGLGGLGLPGDLSSMSRFVRIAFGRENFVCDEDEMPSVSQFFHLLSTVEMTKGLCRTAHGTWDLTVYTSCINASQGKYYYTTYENRQICCVDMHNTDLDCNAISRFSLKTRQKIEYQT